MQPTQPVPRSLDELTEELNRAAKELDAICILATDESGGLLGVSDHHSKLDLQTLAALGTANLASALQLLSLSSQDAHDGQTISTLVEGLHTRFMVAGKSGGIIITALLGPHTSIGLARIEVHELASADWDLPTQHFADDHRLIEEHLSSHDLLDDLFDLPGDGMP